MSQGERVTWYTGTPSIWYTEFVRQVQGGLTPEVAQVRPGQAVRAAEEVGARERLR